MVAPERLLATEHAEAAAGRLLRLTHELRRGEWLLVRWQIGPWLVRSPIRPTSAQRQHRSVWALDGWTTELDSEQITAKRRKSSEHIFACVGQIAVAGASGRRAGHLLASTAGAMQLVRAPGVGVARRALPSWLVARRLRSVRVPTINPPARLTAAELVCLIGWPLGNPRLPGVHYVAAKVLPLDDRVLRAPSDWAGRRVLGSPTYGSQASSVVVLPPKESLRHLWAIGPSGSGKSTLMAHLILSDIAGGRSVVAIDPKGDLVTDVLTRVPSEHRERVVVLDPTDAAPVGFNPLTGGAVGIDGVLHVLRSVWSDSWGPRLGDVLLAGLLTLAQSKGTTLAELPILLTDAAYRQPLVAQAVAEDPLGLGTFWPWFEGLSPEHRAQVLGPVMSRMRALLLRPDLRAVLAQPQPRFDLRSIFTKRYVLLVRLPKGQLGSDGAQLLGSLLVSHVWRLAQGRSAIPTERRHPVSLVLDEFQEFLRLPIDLPDALVQARGLGFGLTLAHQHLAQLDAPVKAAVMANTGSRILFHADHDDATVLAKRTRGLLSAEDLQGLEPFHAYASILAGDATTPYGSLRTRPLGPEITSVDAQMAANRERFGVARGLTEHRLSGLLHGSAAQPPPGGRSALGGRRRPEGEA